MSETTRTPEAVTIGEALAAPFPPAEVKWKAQTVKGNRALAVAFIDARLIQDRLDEVLGVENWEDGYEVLPDGSVVCTLRCNIGGRWISKTDVGSPSDQPDGGDRLKAAFSDALKRAAVKFGVGRYLYRLPAAWVDYDPARKQIVQPPQLPAWARPKSAEPVRQPAPAPAPKPAPEDEYRTRLAVAKTLAELEAAWLAIPRSLQALLAPVKNERKTAVAQR